MTKEQIAGMIKDAEIYEADAIHQVGLDLCCHVLALAAYVEQLQALLARKNAALDTLATKGRFWEGALICDFASHERDAQTAEEK